VRIGQVVATKQEESVRKFAIVGSIGVALGTLGFGALAGATTFTVVPPARVRASVTPPHVLKAPFTFKVTGQIVPPKLLCPTGVTNPQYCSAPPADICSGTVKVSVALGADKYLTVGTKTLVTKTATVAGSCAYSAQYTIPAKDLTAKKHIYGGNKAQGRFIGVYTTASYSGNTYMSAKASNAQITIAKLVNVPK
jgi:hypothetical protein